MRSRPSSPRQACSPPARPRDLAPRRRPRRRRRPAHVPRRRPPRDVRRRSHRRQGAPRHRPDGRRLRGRRARQAPDGPPGGVRAHHRARRRPPRHPRQRRRQTPCRVVPASPYRSAPARVLAIVVDDLHVGPAGARTHAPDADALSRHDGGAGRSRRHPAGVRRKRRPAAVHDRPPAARRGHRARTLGAASRLGATAGSRSTTSSSATWQINGVARRTGIRGPGRGATPRTEGRRVRVRVGRAGSSPQRHRRPGGAAEQDHRPGQPRRRRHLPDRPGRPGHPAADGGGPPGRSAARRTRPAWCAMR